MTVTIDCRLGLSMFFLFFLQFCSLGLISLSDLPDHSSSSAAASSESSSSSSSSSVSSFVFVYSCSLPQDIPIDQQRLLFEGQILQNQQSLLTYSIMEGSSVDLVRCPAVFVEMPLQVETLMGRTVTLLVNSSVAW